MIKFRIFCELLAEMMLESIDFTDVSEGYVEMKSPRDRALQQHSDSVSIYYTMVEMKSPRDRALQQTFTDIFGSINESVEVKNSSR